MTSTKSRRTQRRRLHQHRGGWNPIEHNAAVARRRARDNAHKRIVATFRAMSTTARSSAIALAGLNAAMQRSAERIRHLNTVQTFGRETGLQQDDIDAIIQDEIRRSRKADREPDWERIELRMTTQQIWEAFGA